jgi:antirestriction protein ArdC
VQKSWKGGSAFFPACYGQDRITVLVSLQKADNYCTTALQELVHWTGAIPRLNRFHPGRFGSEKYVFEEMSAGLGCAFSRAGADTKGEWPHERYLSSWLKRLKADNRYLFRAACAASGAHRYLKSS